MMAYEMQMRFTLPNKSWYPANISEEQIAKAVEDRTMSSSQRYFREMDYAIEDIGGLGEIMATVWNTIRHPLDRPESCRPIRPTKGLILHGPSGVGKTMLMEAIAEGCGLCNPKMATFVADHIPLYFNDQVDSTLVKLFNAAKQLRPSVIFIDDFHRVAAYRGPHVRTLANLMDDLDDSGSVFVLAATNRLDKVDPEIGKTGRFDAQIFIGLPSLQARKEILYKRGDVWDVQRSVLDAIADETCDFTGADLSELWRAAYTTAMKRTYPDYTGYEDSTDEENEDERIDYSNFTVEMDDFKEALRIVQPTKPQVPQL